MIITRRRFQKRVEFERKIITVINSTEKISTPIYGLSKQSIDKWKRSNSSLDFKIAELVETLANDLMLYCDNSKNTFDIDKRITGSEILNKIDRLKISVS